MARCVVFIGDMQTWQSGIVTKINKISSEYLVELVMLKREPLLSYMLNTAIALLSRLWNINFNMVVYHDLKSFDTIKRLLLGVTLTKEDEVQLGDHFSQYVDDAVVEAAYVSGAYEFLKNNYQSIPLFVSSGTPDKELK